MKVFDLRCAHGHAFEGWFASEDDCAAQSTRGLIGCPLCGATEVRRVPSAARLNLSGAAAPEAPGAAAAGARTGVDAGAGAGAGADTAAGAAHQARWMRAMRDLLARTEDVGERFAEEARRIHYGEAAERGIRGRATPEEAEALADEGIGVLPLPVPPALEGPLQ